MGKLLEKLQQIMQGSSGAVGFVGLARPQGEARAPRPAAIFVRLDAGAAGAGDAAVKQGADGLIVTGWRGADDSRAVRSLTEGGSAIWGVEFAARSYEAGQLKQAKDAGASFAVISGEGPAHLIVEDVDGLDIIATVEVPTDDLSLILLRAENFLPVQAALVRADLTPAALAKMTVAEFARLRLVCESLRFPTLLTLAGAPDATHVRTLVRLGVGGLVLSSDGLSADKFGAQIKTLREQLEKIPIRAEDRMPIAIGGLMESSGASLAPQRSPRREPEPEPDEE